MRKSQDIYNFKALGQAIKREREARGWTREQLSEKIDLAPRYIMSIENEGQHPSLQKFYEFVTLFQLSVDEFFFPDANVKRGTRRLQLDALLDEMSESELIVMSAAARGVMEASCTVDEKKVRSEMAETVIELLQEAGIVREEICCRIRSENNMSVLKHWLRNAARAVSVEEFVETSGILKQHGI